MMSGVTTHLSTTGAILHSFVHSGAVQFFHYSMHDITTHVHYHTQTQTHSTSYLLTVHDSHYCWSHIQKHFHKLNTSTKCISVIKNNMVAIHDTTALTTMLVDGFTTSGRCISTAGAHGTCMSRSTT